MVAILGLSRYFDYISRLTKSKTVPTIHTSEKSLHIVKEREGIVAKALMWQYVNFVLQRGEADFSRIPLDFGYYASVVELVEGYHVYLISPFTIPPVSYQREFSGFHCLSMKILLQRSACKLLVVLAHILSQ